MSIADDLHKYLVIVAGGMGTRMGSSLPKQFMTVAGRPVLMHSVERFTSLFPDIEIIIVLAKTIREQWEELCRKHDFIMPHHIADGGEQRFYSVKNALHFVKKESLVAVHDSVRPFVSHETITRCFNMAALHGNAIPVIGSGDSLRLKGTDGSSQPLDRNRVMIVQTPQVFRSEIILEAYKTPFRSSFTDDASVVESIGEQIMMAEGNTENIKITNPSDIIIGEGIAKYYLNKSSSA